MHDGARQPLRVHKAAVTAEGVKMPIGSAALLSGAIVLAAFILGGRFAITDPVRAGLGDTVIVFRMDRLTGSVSRCNTEGCERLPEI